MPRAAYNLDGLRKERILMARDDGYKTIDEYIAQYPANVQERLQQIRKTIREAAPEAAEKISWAMPTFYQKGNLVHFAAFKKHIGFFPGADGIEAFKDQFIKNNYSYSKGGVQLPLDQPLPVELISEIVRFRVAQNMEAAM
jgi:uncharacterized protein YdhG (YjbR/CyaY superfamily)